MELKLPQPGFWLAAGLAALVVGLQSAISMPVAVLDMVLKESLNQQGAGLLRNPLALSFMNTVAFSAVIGFALFLNRLPLRQAYPWARTTLAQMAIVALLAVGSVIVLSELDNLMRAVLPMPEFVRQLLEEIFSEDTSILAQAFLLVVVAPLTEELLFRGIILRGLLGRYRAWLAISITAALFAFIHLNPWQMVTAFAIGLSLGWIYLRSGSVWLCVLGHAINNGLFLLARHAPFEVQGLVGIPDPDEVVFQPWWLDVLGVLLVLLAVWLFRRATPCPPRVHEEPPPVIEPPIIEPPVISQP